MAITWKKLAYSDDPPIAHDLDSVLHTAAGGDVGKYINISGASLVQYRTPAEVLSDIAAAAVSHAHAGTDITSGFVPVAYGGVPDPSAASAGDHLVLNGSKIPTWTTP